MKPQQDEPCNDGIKWNDETGCTAGHYNSAAMVVFGYCGFAKPKKENQDE